MNDITKGNLSKNFILFAIPVIISGVLNQVYTTVDKIMVGQFMGETGLAAVGSTSTFITLLLSILWGLATGVSVYVAFLSTSGDKSRTANVIKANLLVIAAIAVAVSAIAILLYKPIFTVLAIGSEIWHDALVYYVIYLVGFVCFTFCNAASYIFNAIGKPSLPMKLSVFSCVGNICFNYVFMRVLDLGVAGAAIGSILVAFITCIFYIVRLAAEFRLWGCGGERLRFCRADILPALRQGVPCMIQQFIMYISGAAVQPVVNLLGTAAIASYSVCSEIYSICATVFQNSSRGLSSFCAQCYGKGEYKLVRKGVKISIRQGILLSAPIMAVLLIFSSGIAKIFLGDKASPQSMEYVMQYVYMCVPFVLCQIVNNLFHNFYRGVMMPRLATVSTAVYTVMRIAVTYAFVWKLGMLGIFLGFVIPWVTECALSVFFYTKGFWKNSIYKKAERL